MNRALIIGSAGQDGSYLSEQLRAEGYTVVGVDRHTAGCNLLDAGWVSELVRSSGCDALFYLAAHHHSSEDPSRALGEELLRAQEVHVTGWIHCLEALVNFRPGARSFYAASSHVFGEGKSPTLTLRPGLVTEDTPFAPRSAYAVTKAAGVEVGRLYRARGRHVSSGFLFNHESPRRAARFVSQRIAQGAVAAARSVALGKPFSLELGSLSAVVDWGYAPDYTKAMLRIVRCDAPGDYIVATGVPHTIEDWCSLAFGAVGLDWRRFVIEQPGRVTRQVAPLLGDSSRLRAATGWAPSMTFENMVMLMVEAAARDERGT